MFFMSRKHVWDQNPVFTQSAIEYSFESIVIILRVDDQNMVMRMMLTLLKSIFFESGFGSGAARVSSKFGEKVGQVFQLSRNFITEWMLGEAHLWSKL
jgi:hypothetical protein